MLLAVGMYANYMNYNLSSRLCTQSFAWKWKLFRPNQVQNMLYGNLLLLFLLFGNFLHITGVALFRLCDLYQIEWRKKNLMKKKFIASSIFKYVNDGIWVTKYRYITYKKHENEVNVCGALNKMWGSNFFSHFQYSLFFSKVKKNTHGPNKVTRCVCVRLSEWVILIENLCYN